MGFANTRHTILISIKKLKDRTWEQIVIQALDEVGKHKKLGAYGKNYVNRMVTGHSR